MLSDAESPVQAPVLLIEDDPDISHEIHTELEAGGYSVHSVATLEDGLNAARSDGARVLILDRMLGDEDGLAIIKALRDEGNSAPRSRHQRACEGRRSNQRPQGRW